MLLPRDVDVEALSPEEVGRLRDENAALKEEIARLKGLKGRPRLTPSGMERASAGRAPRTQPPKRGKTTKRVVHEERVLAITAPPGSRFKGYEDIVVQDLRLEARVIRYRRQRWLTPEGRTLVAPLPAGIQGHFGPELHRFVVLQHHQGQVTAERITAFLSSLGVTISKRQVVRLLTAKSAALVAEAQAVLRAGLETARWITVDDTGARHRARNGVTTQIGDHRFTAFATNFSKSRRNFLEILRAGHADYVVNEDALAYMRAHDLAGPVSDLLAAHPIRRFAARPALQGPLPGLWLPPPGGAPGPGKLA